MATPLIVYRTMRTYFLFEKKKVSKEKTLLERSGGWGGDLLGGWVGVMLCGLFLWQEQVLGELADERVD